MWKIIIFFAISLQLTQAFDIDGWVKKFCVKNKKEFVAEELHQNLFCENARFTKQESDDIQKGGFVISNSKIMLFKGGDIGLLNEHFLRKFPHCEQLFFDGVKIKLDESSEFINHLVQSITFTGCDISGIKGSQLFQHLKNLTNLTFIGNKFDESVFNKNFLDHLAKIASLKIENNIFAKIEDNV